MLSSVSFAQNTRIDHVLIAVNNLDSAVVDYERLGFSVTFGGARDKALNALIFLEDGTLIELIGKDRFPVYYSFFTSIGISRFLGPMKDRIARFPKAPEGLFNYCLYARDLDSAYISLKANGFNCGKPITLSRKREDGVSVTWNLIGLRPYDLPFYINDYDPPRLSNKTLQAHENGASGIDSLEVITNDFDTYMKLYNLLYDQSAKTFGSPGERNARYQLNGQYLILYEAIKPFRTFNKGENSMPLKVYLKSKSGEPKKSIKKYLYL